MRPAARLCDVEFSFVRIPRSPLAAAFVVAALISPIIPVAAQDDIPSLAPAIGPWLGAPRGTITQLAALEGEIVVDFTVSDRDSATRIDYEILVDGRRAASGRTLRPDEVGEAVGVTRSLQLTPGLHEICIRLEDRRLGTRTVDCQRGTTAPPDRVTSSLADGATGAVVAPSGVVVPVTGGTPGDWRITTPCGAPATLSAGSFVPRARVVIDPGHGGSESGAWGQGIIEKDLNLVVSNLLVEELRSLGITAELTRTADYRVPIRTRADIATALAPDVFISVHHNGGARRASSRPGTEVFYANGSAESERLARIMYEDMVDALDDFDVAWVSTVNEGASVRLRDDGMDLYGIHRFSPDVNSIITEFVYLSNPPEAALMLRPGMAQLEAEVIVDALLRWWWTDDAGTSLGRRFTDSSSTGTGGFDGCTDPSLTNPASLSIGRAQRLVEDLTAEPEAFVLLPALYLGTDPDLG